MADTNGGAAPQQPGAPEAQPGTQTAQPMVQINAQYVKDLSFENPRAPQSLLQSQQQPEVQIGVDVKAQTIAAGLYEVQLTIHADAKTGADRVFLVELVYCGIVTAQNIPEANLGPILLVETPRILFPFARAIIASATREGGFMPLLLRPIDFADLLRQQQERGASGQTAVA